MATKAKILVAEHEQIVMKDIENLLIDWGYSVPDLPLAQEELFNTIEQRKPDLVILGSGINDEVEKVKVARQISSQFNIAVIVLVSWVTEEVKKVILALQSIYCMMRPFDKDELQKMVEQALVQNKN